MTTTNQVTQDEWVGPVSATDTMTLDFPLLDDDDIDIVHVDDATAVETPMVKGTDYSVTTGVPPVLTNITAFLIDETWKIQRRISHTQETDLVTGDKLPAESIEATLDLLTHQLADLRSELARCIRVPDGEQPVAADWMMSSAVARASAYLFFDANGNFSVNAGTGDVGAVTFHANGESLVGSAYATMRTLMDVLQDVFTTQGDLLVEGSSGPARLAASARPGRVLSASSLNLSEETGEGSALEPEWLRPEVHPFLDVQGFPACQDSVTPLTKIKVGQGVCQPKFVSGASGTLMDYSDDGHELRLDIGLTDNWVLNLGAAWAAGDTAGKLADSFSMPSSGVAYLFVIGRSADNVVDFAVGSNIDGTDVAATTAIITWADTGADGHLFLRRIWAIPTIAGGGVSRFYTLGNHMHFITQISEGSPVIDSASQDTVLCDRLPAEPCIVDFRFQWDPPLAGDIAYAFNNQNKGDTPSASHAVFITTSATAEQADKRLFISSDRNIYVESDTATTSTLFIFMLGYEDPRGRFVEP